MYGPRDRTPAYWQWLLLRRRSHDQIYVALDGPDLWDMEEATTAIVGYVVLKGDRVVELLTVPGRHKVAAELLAHACGDAIEHDHHSLVLQAPPNHFLHEVFSPEKAAGTHHAEPEFERGEAFMARILDPLALLQRLRGEFCRRARRAHLPGPLELGLQVEGQRWQIELGDTGAEVVPQRMGRSYLRLNAADFTRLVLGQLDWDRAVADGRLEPSSALAQQAGRVLFPRLPLWYPPWDDLPA
jgi:hypothetical protein